MEMAFIKNIKHLLHLTENKEFNAIRFNKKTGAQECGFSNIKQLLIWKCSDITEKV
jgi:hypothetical protein